SVNISARQLRQTDLVGEVEAALSESGLAPASLVLEMTESVLMEHTDEKLAVLTRLKETGVRLAIDDFGTGYSSLSYLNRFPIDVLKVDRSFVGAIGNGGGSDERIVESIVQLARQLGMEVVAEGVETAEQRDRLQAMGCDLAQGYFFARPMAFDRVAEVVRASHDRPADDRGRS